VVLMTRSAIRLQDWSDAVLESAAGVGRRPRVGAVRLVLIVSAAVALLDKDEARGLIEPSSADVAGENVQPQAAGDGLLRGLQQRSSSAAAL
jgi:hypothetical protein